MMFFHWSGFILSWADRNITVLQFLYVWSFIAFFATARCLVICWLPLRSLTKNSSCNAITRIVAVIPFSVVYFCNKIVTIDVTIISKTKTFSCYSLGHCALQVNPLMLPLLPEIKYISSALHRCWMFLQSHDLNYVIKGTVVHTPGFAPVSIWYHIWDHFGFLIKTIGVIFLIFFRKTSK